MFYYAHSMYILFTVLFYVEKYKIVHYLYIKARLFSKNTKIQNNHKNSCIGFPKKHTTFKL